MLFSSAFILPNFRHTYTNREVTRIVWSSDMLGYEELDTRQEGLELGGRIPLLNGYTSPVQTRVNNAIDCAVASKISNARDMRARSLFFEFESYFSDPYMSIILKSTTESASSKTEVVSINFNTDTGSLVTAEDVVGPQVVQLAERLIIEMIRRNPVHFNPSFAGIRTEQAFSLTDREISFWFDEFQLVAGSGGVETLSLQRNSIKEIELTKNEYHIREGFNLKMIPLRQVAESLGYSVEWCEETLSASVYHNGELVIELKIGVNDYVREGRFTRSLEAAPERRYGHVYVPISFFDQILSLVAFTIDERDNITFASYPVTDAWFEPFF